MLLLQAVTMVLAFLCRPFGRSHTRGFLLWSSQQTHPTLIVIPEGLRSMCNEHCVLGTWRVEKGANENAEALPVPPRLVKFQGCLQAPKIEADGEQASWLEGCAIERSCWSAGSGSRVKEGEQ